MNAPNLKIYDSRQAASRAMAALVAQIGESTLSTRNQFTLALSGGNSPREAFKMIGDEFAEDIDWQKTHIFWGDERAVPFSDSMNNARMAREAMLDYVPIPLDHVHRVHSYLPPEEAAAQYNQHLRTFFHQNVPRFDCVLLGMGADGHTASLFPGQNAIHETERWFVAEFIDAVDAWRLTGTLPLFNNAANVIFLVFGEDKAEALAHIVSRTEIGLLLPAGQIAPNNGRVTWIVDEAAAGMLRQRVVEE